MIEVEAQLYRLFGDEWGSLRAWYEAMDRSRGPLYMRHTVCDFC